MSAQRLNTQTNIHEKYQKKTGMMIQIYVMHIYKKKNFK